MRSFSTAEQDVLGSKNMRVAWRVLAENSTGGFVDLTTLGGINWCDSVEWTESIDQPVSQATFMLRRDVGPSTGKSLAPMDEVSTFNLNSTGGYAPLLWAGREIKLETATVPISCAPSSAAGDYKLAFYGEIDRVDWELPAIAVLARDLLGSQLADRWIESAGDKYGTDTGEAIQTTMQSILTDWTTGSTGSIGLVTPVAPSFRVIRYPPGQVPVLDAVTALGDLIGWYVRPQWVSTSSGFGLVLAEPSRSQSTADYTFGPDRYLDVRALSIDRLRVRNAIRVPYFSTGGVQKYAYSTDDASILEYGRRWMNVPQDANSAIHSSSEAQALADAILEDLKDPEAEQEIETYYFWPAQLDDYLGFTANGIHYSADQNWGLYQIRHALSMGQQGTFLRVRGQPASANLRWRKQASTEGGAGGSTSIDPNAEALLTELTLAEINSTAGKYTLASVVVGANSLRWKLWERDSTGALWPTQDGSENGAVDDAYLRGEWQSDVTSAGLHSAASSAGTRYAVAVGVNSAGRPGPRKTASLAISTSTAGAGAGALYGLEVMAATSGAIVLYPHDDVVENDTTGRYVVDIYRGNLGSAAEVIVASSRAAKTDHTSTSGFQGSILDGDLIRCEGALGDRCSYYAFTYRVVLRDKQSVFPDKSYSAEIGGSFDDVLSSNLL